ncbi:unnamed protein product, partial [Ectocarpus sp. 12 AP-2014]
LGFAQDGPGTDSPVHGHLARQAGRDRCPATSKGGGRLPNGHAAHDGFAGLLSLRFVHPTPAAHANRGSKTSELIRTGERAGCCPVAAVPRGWMVGSPRAECSNNGS